ncbi:hypothetical protein lerEdw1_011745, partial [Lerista edwardsae]
GPGSGKGTQCDKLAQKYGFTHLSIEDLLRREMSSLSERSKTIKEAMESGELVPGLEDDSFRHAGAASTGDDERSTVSVLGTEQNLYSSIQEIVTELLKEAIASNLGETAGFLIDGYPQELKQGEDFESQIGEPSLVLCMDCSSKTMSSRLLKRSQSSQCLDDNAEAIMKCIETYYQVTEPVIAYYESKVPLFKVN